MRINEKIKSLREKNGYDQTYIAKQLGITRQGYNHYETGKRIPPLDILKKLCLIFKVDMNELTKDTDEIAPIEGKKEEQDISDKIYNKLVEINNGEDLTINQIDDLFSFFQNNTDYVSFLLNKHK